MTIRTFLQTILGPLLFSLGLGASVAQTFTVAVVPQFTAEQIFHDWTPVLKEVSRLTGLDLKLKTYASIPAFEIAFLNGEPDVAYMNPYHAVMAKKAVGYTPIVRDDATRMTGLLMVRKDSPITRLEQLNGTELAFAAPNAFSSLIIRALLTNEHKIPFRAKYVTTPSNVYRHVISHAQPGGTLRHMLEEETPELQAQLRVLYETPGFYRHPIVTHPRVPAQVREALQQAFLKLGANPAFAERLRAIQLPKPVIADFKDYVPLEKLGLEKFAIIPN